MPYRITLDLGKCSRAAICEHVAPDIFKITSEGPSLLISEPLADALIAQTEDAVDLCPMQAIELVAVRQA